MRGQFGGALQQIVLLQQLQGSQSGGAGDGVGGIGVAVAELYGVQWQILAHEGLVDFFAGNDCAHGDGAVGQLLGHGHDVGGDAKVLSPGISAQAAQAGDDFIKDQQDVVLIANLAQALQVASRWHQYACRARDGFDNNGGDGAGIVQFDQFQQFVGQGKATCLG